MLTELLILCLFLFLFSHMPKQLFRLPLIRKSRHKHVWKGWFSMATASQVTNIRITDKSHLASVEKEGKKQEQASCLPKRSSGSESCSDNHSRHSGHEDKRGSSRAGDDQCDTGPNFCEWCLKIIQIDCILKFQVNWFSPLLSRGRTNSFDKQLRPSIGLSQNRAEASRGFCLFHLYPTWRGENC